MMDDGVLTDDSIKDINLEDIVSDDNSEKKLTPHSHHHKSNINNKK
jgi:hypothetical protein